MMRADEALAFIETHGVVLVAAKGPVPRLVEAILGEPIRGSWWAHPASHQIFAVLTKVGESNDLLMCRLVEDKVTLVHRRLWPALVRMESRFTRRQLAQLHQEHTSSGRHRNRVVAFPSWVPEIVTKGAAQMSAEQAEQALAAVLGPARARGQSRR
jgi:hypothetical protein